MKNLRKEARMKGYPLWMIADVIGVCEMTLTRWFRHNDLDHMKLIRNAIDILDERNKA